ETSVVAVGGARGTPRTSFFEGCPPSPFAPSYASAATDVPGGVDVGAASTSAKRRSSKGKGGRVGGGGSEGGGGGSSGGGGGSRGGDGCGSGGGSGGFGGGGGGSFGSGGSGSGAGGGGRIGAQRGDLLRSGVAIFDLEFDAILAAMYALSVSAEGDCYRCVPPKPGIEVAALGASESVLPGTAAAEALHAFTLDSGASCCFFRYSTTLTPLSAPVPVRLANPSGGPVLARSSTVLPSLAYRNPPGRDGHYHDSQASACVDQHVYMDGLSPGHTLLWHHRLGHPSLPRLRGMHSRLLVSGLPGFLPPLPPSPALPCIPCVEERQRAAPHSSSFPPTTPPLQTLHMDVWGLAHVTRQGRERYFLLVVDNYTRYTTVFPFRNNGQVVDVLISWIRAVGLQLRKWFRTDLSVLRLHSDRGGEFSSNLLRDFCLGEGILQTSLIPPCSMRVLHVFYGHWLSGTLRTSSTLPETSPTLRWTGKVGDASVFRVWGSGAFVCDTSTDKLSTRAIPCVFLGFSPDAPGWQFYHPTSCRDFPSQDVTFDDSSLLQLPFSRTPPPQGPAPSGVSQVDPLPGTAPIEVAVGSSAAPGAASGGAAPGGAEPGGAESKGAESGGAEPRGTASSGAGDSTGGDTGAGGAGVTVGAGGTGGSAAAGLGGARTRGTGAAGTRGVGRAKARDPSELGAAGTRGAGVGGTGAGGAGAGGAGAVDPRAGGARGAVRPRPYFVPLLQQVLGVPPSTGLPPPLLCPPPDQSQPLFQPASPLPAPSPYTAQTGGLTERREHESRPASTVCTGRHVPHPHPPRVPGTHAMAHRPSSVPLHVPLPPSHASSLPAVLDPESDGARAASPTVSRLLATIVTDPSFESTAAFALVAELVEFAAACRLDHATTLVAECAQEDFECLAAAVPRFASMLLAPEGDLDALDIPTPRSYVEEIAGPYSSQRQAAMDAEMASWKSTGTYVDAVPPSQANIVDDMWIFRVKRPPGSSPALKARYVARGFSQRKGVECFQTFSPTPKMTTRWVLQDVAAQCNYKLYSLDFSTAFLQGSLHEEIRLPRPPGFTGSFPAGTQWSLGRQVYNLYQAPCEWHDTLRTTLAALWFAPSTADPMLFLRTDSSLFYVLVYVADLVFATVDTEALTLVKSELTWVNYAAILACRSPGTEHGAPSP
ncbi:unnamed protein product, partial [Closterium sp. NIES-54]